MVSCAAINGGGKWLYRMKVPVDVTGEALDW